jgi:hypothetical protein
MYQPPLNLTEQRDLREIIATCLLSEIGSSSDNEENITLLQRASSLLRRDFQMQASVSNDEMIVLDMLQKSCDTNVEYSGDEKTLPDEIQSFLTSVLSKETFPGDITYVADTESYRELLLPWIKASIRYGTNPLGLLVP